jgi:hypothetical protein
MTVVVSPKLRSNDLRGPKLCPTGRRRWISLSISSRSYKLVSQRVQQPVAFSSHLFESVLAGLVVQEMLLCCFVIVHAVADAFDFKRVIQESTRVHRQTTMGSQRPK